LDHAIILVSNEPAGLRLIKLTSGSQHTRCR